jgi:hypothetical protein
MIDWGPSSGMTHTGPISLWFEQLSIYAVGFEKIHRFFSVITFAFPTRKYREIKSSSSLPELYRESRLTRGPQPRDRKWDGRPGGLDEKLHGNKLEFGEKRQNAGREGDWYLRNCLESTSGSVGDDEGPVGAAPPKKKWPKKETEMLCV